MQPVLFVAALSEKFKRKLKGMKGWLLASKLELLQSPSSCFSPPRRKKLLKYGSTYYQQFGFDFTKRKPSEFVWFDDLEIRDTLEGVLQKVRNTSCQEVRNTLQKALQLLDSNASESIEFYRGDRFEKSIKDSKYVVSEKDKNTVASKLKETFTRVVQLLETDTTLSELLLRLHNTNCEDYVFLEKELIYFKSGIVGIQAEGEEPLWFEIFDTFNMLLAIRELPLVCNLSTVESQKRYQRGSGKKHSPKHFHVNYRC